MNYNVLKREVAEIVKRNGRQEITGDNLQSTLLGMIDSLGKYATYGGIAQPMTDPKNPDQNIFFFAVEAGNYARFGGLDVPNGLSVIYPSALGWETEVLFSYENVAVKGDIAELKSEIMRELQKYLTIESARGTYATKDNVQTGDEALHNEIAALRAKHDNDVQRLDGADTNLQNDIDRVEQKEAEDVRLLQQEDVSLEGLIVALTEREDSETVRVNRELQRITIKDGEQDAKINALISRSDVVDVVATKAALDSYDIGTITINDVIKVLRDESRKNEITYYRLVRISPKEWKFIGSLGEVYTKEQSDGLFLTKTDAQLKYLTQKDAANEYLNKVDAAKEYLNKTEGDKKYMERNPVDFSHVINQELTRTSTTEGELVYNEFDGRFAAKAAGNYYISSTKVAHSGEYPQIGRIYKTADRTFIGTLNGLSELNKSTITTY